MALTEQTVPPTARLEEWNRDLEARTAQERVRWALEELLFF